ncbi:MAG TPA: DUF1810 domain-containing protein [Xanthobacteraceae bacterium]|nr:DUF1810 domain-containing protein [Xanthobacteraceae bacterium]
MDDPYHLQRFVDAQAPVYQRVVAELRHGQKQSHWMWFIFPQLKGLGSSAMANKFAIASRAEAEAYLEHPTLGARLRECARLVTAVQHRTIEEILGHPDDLKFRSSMTLFAAAAADSRDFTDALDKFYCGKADPATLERL